MKVCRTEDDRQAEIEGRLGALAEALCVLDLMQGRERKANPDIEFVASKIRQAQKVMAEGLPKKYRRCD